MAQVGTEERREQVRRTLGRPGPKAGRGSARIDARPAVASSRTIAAFLVPAGLLLVLFAYYPMLRGFSDAFYNDNGTSATFAGLANFRQAFTNPLFQVSWVHMIEIGLRWVVLELTVPLAVARAIIALPSNRARTVLRTLFVIPMVVSIPIIALVWGALLAPGGPVNALLSDIGLPFLRQQWLANPHLALYSIMAIGFPWVDGFALLVFTGGLQALPREVLEAASLDGASMARTFFKIELPLISGQVRLVLVFAVITALTLITQVLVLTDGGPGNATLVPGLAIYNEAFLSSQFGMANALGLIVFAMAIGLTVAILRVGRRQ